MEITSASQSDQKSLLPSRSKTSICHCINARLVPSKLCFFLNDVFQVTYSSFAIVFFTSVGLTVREAGTISGLCLITSFLTTPLWGCLVDYTGRTKYVFVILCVGTGVTFFPLPWIAASLLPIHYDKNSTSITTTKYSVNEFSSNLFYVMLLLQCVFSIFKYPIRGFTVAFVMNIVKISDAEFGRQNLFGSVGVCIFSIINGFAVEQYSSKHLSPYTPIFYVFLACCLLLIPIGLMTASQVKKSNVNTVGSTHRIGRLKTLFNILNCRVVLFIVSVVLSGMCNTAVGTYLFQLMSDEMKSSKFVMGLATTIASLSEIATFLFAKYINWLFGGARKCIIASIFSYCVRCFLLAYIQNEWLVLPVQMLQGLGFAMFWVSAAEYTYELTNDQIYATLFSLLISLYSNIGGLFGSFCAGIIYNGFGGKTLFFSIGCVCGVWTFLNVICLYISRLRSNNIKEER